ncbi:hypothetical protein ACLB2K_001130 [Fragaria x ananassa]
MQALPISSRSHFDKWIWAPDRKGLFTVKSAYHLARTRVLEDHVMAPNPSAQLWNKIWNAPVPGKVMADLAPGFVRDIGADKAELEFKKPKSLKIGGSYAIGCLVKPEFNVDLFVQLPKECFHEKDYLNYRYHAKRCLYLCVIKKYLTLSALVGKVEWSTFQNEVRKPVLIVYPVKKLVALPGFFVRIIPTAPSLFSIPKLNLQRNNVRAVSKGGIPQATPKYNSSILEDMFIEDTEEIVKQTFLGSKELREGLILLKLQNESTMTLACIEKCRDSGFEEVFMTKIDYPVKYDHVIRLNLKGKSSVYVSGFCLDDECWRVYEQKVYNVLSHGLSDRVKTLEGSGNWPMDDVAIEKTKSAFLLKIGESLQNSWGMTCTATEDDVDVFVSGYAFRLKIWHERGLTLMRRETGNEHVNKVSNVDKELYFRSQHSSMINGLQTCYPAYGPVVRLAKRWAASHLFSACLEEEAVELLVAYIFLKPLPFNAPCSRITGFLRFLRLLSDYDWTFSALVVDINNDLTPNDEKEIRENFMFSRKGYEENPQNVNSALFLATAYDKASEAWTRFSPNSVVSRSF